MLPYQGLPLVSCNACLPDINKRFPRDTVQVQDSQHRQTKHLELVQWLSWAQSTSSVIIYQPHGASALFFHVHEDQDPVATRIPAEAAPHSRFFFLLFIWLHRILVVAHRTFDLSCGM